MEGAAALGSLEPLIFEKSTAGRRGLDVKPEATPALPARLLREDLDGFPEVSEPDVIRHYARLSKLNYSAATHFYPLGSCTMKYNPVVNDRLAGLPGFAAVHPYAPVETVQGVLRLLKELERWLCEVSGLAAVSLQPAAGAQGELAGIKMIRAWHEARGRARS
jgi:glycine dehydrogenase subunit 2